MPESFTIKSRLKDYQLYFVDDVLNKISDQRNTGAFLIIDSDLPGKNKIEKLFAKERIIGLHASEKTKTYEGCAKLINQLLKAQVRRNNMIYAVGGGVIEDVVAFVAQVLFRGLEWTFIPTTLLSQADSCIGSKSSINFGGYKNLLGSFYPPSQIFIDFKFLKTLAKVEIKSGIGEILHFYLVAGKLDLAEKMMPQYQLFLKSPILLRPYIWESLRVKKNVIERDELDRGERNLFNYGHTFGHAIESVTNYKICHGQAVTMGMDIANFLSYKRGYINEEEFKRLHDLFSINLPRFRLTLKNWPQYATALSKDKKNIGKTLGCILTKGPGKMFKAQLAFDEALKSDILSYFDQQ